MSVLTVKQARDKLKRHLDDVCRNQRFPIIVRKRGESEVVLRDFDGLQERFYLLALNG